MSAAAVSRRAAQWMARLWSDDASEADRQACARWRAAHPDHERAWQQLQAFEGRLLSVPADIARHALREPAGQGRQKRRRVLQALGVAFTASGVAWVAGRSPAWQHVVADMRTATGEIRELTLPDGSRVVLSSATAIDVRFDARERRLVLRAGEILVQTAPQAGVAHRPFRVQVEQGVVEALGTRFAVRHGETATRVAVFEHAVEVRPAGLQGDRVRLQAGQGADLRFDGVGDMAAAPPALAAWRDGILVADGMRLDTFVAELARFRPGLLSCDEAVAHLRVSGIFSLRDTDRALHNLARALPVRLAWRTRYWVVVRPA